jgi:hypothetical protein
MKKLIVIIMLFVSLAGFAESSWLEVEFAFQAGWIPNGAVHFYNPPDTIFLNSFDTTFEINANAFDFVKMGGKCVSLFSTYKDNIHFKNDFINFWPTGMTYLVYLGIEPLKGFSIKYEHSCSHPVAIFLPDYPGNPLLDKSYDRIYFELRSKINF